MKRVLILGCCGAGKSTFTKLLEEKTGLPVIHLDQCYWQPEWTETPKAEWQKTVEKLIEKDSWIIDGNYGGTLEIRAERADTIIYLDRSTWLCFRRVIQRIWKYKGKTRPDMTQDCPERFDLDFLHYVLTFNIIRRKSILSKIKALSETKNIQILRSETETNDFLKSIRTKDS